MTNYKIILDEYEFDNFINFLPELAADEVFYLSLFGRHKYCTTLPNLKDNTFARFTARKTEIKEKVRRLECPIGGYKRDGLDVPQEALALYIALNPRSLVKANKALLIEIATAFTENRANFNPLSLARTALHNATDRKLFVDFDYDGIEPAEYFPKIKEVLPAGAYRVLKTRGGFHLIVLTAKAPNNNWFKTFASLKGCDVKGSKTLIPCPGCCQGNFVPFFV